MYIEATPSLGLVTNSIVMDVAMSNFRRSSLERNMGITSIQAWSRDLEGLDLVVLIESFLYDKLAP